MAPFSSMQLPCMLYVYVSKPCSALSCINNTHEWAHANTLDGFSAYFALYIYCTHQGFGDTNLILRLLVMRTHSVGCKIRCWLCCFIISKTRKYIQMWFDKIRSTYPNDKIKMSFMYFNYLRVSKQKQILANLCGFTLSLKHLCEFIS